MNIHVVSTNSYQVVVSEQEGNYSILFKDPVAKRVISLDRSEDKEYAISSANKFPKLHEIAQHQGFTLSGDEFVNKVGRSITVNEAFDTDRSFFDFESLLKSLNEMPQ